MMRALCLRALKCGSGKRKNILLSWDRESEPRQSERSCHAAAKGAHLSFGEKVGEELHRVGPDDADVLEPPRNQMVHPRLYVVVFVVFDDGRWAGPVGWWVGEVGGPGSEETLLPSEGEDLVRDVLTYVGSDFEACRRGSARSLAERKRRTDPS